MARKVDVHEYASILVHEYGNIDVYENRSTCPGIGK